MWLLFQCGIMFAVFASNVSWRWSDNPVFTALVAIFAAFIATSIVNGLLNLKRGKPFGSVD